MKIVIDIPEDVYKRTVFNREFKDLNDCVTTIKALENGTLLPKGHGRLIDADELYDCFIDGTEGYDCQTWNRIEIGDIIEDTPTIIEADKESEDKEGMKGLFIPGITEEMFRNGCLESIKAIMAEGEIYDIDYSPWIPVSERLPEKQDCYLVTTKWKGSYSDDVYIETNMAVYRERPKEWDCKDVIAWMPLPEPYKEGDNDSTI